MTVQRPHIKEQTIFDNASSDGWGTVVDTRGHDEIHIMLTSSNSPSFTVKFAGSVSDSQPDFTSSATIDNHWIYWHAYNMEDPGGGIAGDTGLSVSSAKSWVVMLNTERVRWVNLEISGHSSGNLDAKAVAANE